MMQRMIRLLAATWVIGIWVLPAVSSGGTPAASPALTKIRLSVDEDPIVPRLAESLGYFRDEGIEIVPAQVEQFAAEDYLLQAPLIEGKIDAAYHWFHHAVFGARHRLPITAVMMFNDAPAMTILVPRMIRDRIRSAADFTGLRIAQGAGYGTKSLLTAWLANKSGLRPHAYTPILMESQGRQAAVIAALQSGSVDVMTFQEPVTSALQQTGLVTALYNFNDAASTIKVFGAPWPAQSLLMAPRYLKNNPDGAQHLVNALVRTMRFINSHTATEIAAALPPAYFDGKDRAAEIALLDRTLPAYARGDYRVPTRGANLVVQAIQFYDFDASPEGKWRARSEVPAIDRRQLFDNQFVIRAMRRYP
jgi:NitT/TauT family transport system substrate-binding protein